MKLWSGRFSADADRRTDEFNSSIAVDSRMAEEDITGSLAHADMLAAYGIIDAADGALIAEGLSDILAGIKSGALMIDPGAEDIHMFVEAELTRRIGDAGKRLHTARSRNDQVATDVRLTLRGMTDTLVNSMEQLIALLCKKAERYAASVMPGYTHMQRAQPVTLGHHLMAYAEMLMRDRSRFADARGRMNRCPLGAGALAGTTYPIDRGMTAAALGFDGACKNSIDAVSDRDFCAELAFCAALCMVHLSRLCEELILWCSWEFRYIQLDDAYATGSSMMPQKKNPDIAELIRGKTGRAVGDLTTLLVMLKGLPLAYNKDMQEDKEAVFDALDTLAACITPLIPMLDTMRVNETSLRAAAARGFINATDCADYLVREKNIPFRDAYAATGAVVKRCIELDATLETLPLAEYCAICTAFDDGIYASVGLDACLQQRSCEGGPAPQNVKREAAGILAQLCDVTG